ncbi:hypothetical protein [Aporhodopirellula aestuarii]|uniref:Uncharacterized protein n=1 Tax=Aporhodopirellula aestuarii TaxID=2950107 RepID=A0ABT0U8D1_9BACT|nr:hypothetical protein [Aporhodopirellula aestuarii]MCM2373067.1 hypothetical protein [Aporhodopirellula aestuarii]
MRTQTSRRNDFHSAKWAPGRRKKSQSGAEVSLKIVIGMIFGTEVIGGPTLLSMSVFWDLEVARLPSFGAVWLMLSAAAGAWGCVRYLPRFSRDRGRVADFLIDPKQVRSSLGYYDHPNR